MDVVYDPHCEFHLRLNPCALLHSGNTGNEVKSPAGAGLFHQHSGPLGGGDRDEQSLYNDGELE
jgi:methylglyoxal synthase